MNEIIIVGQDEGAPLLHLQAILTTGDSLSAVHLGGLEVLRTQPGLINHLGGRQRGEGKGGEKGRQGWGWGGVGGGGAERISMSVGGIHWITRIYTHTCTLSRICASSPACTDRDSHRAQQILVVPISTV